MPEQMDGNAYVRMAYYLHNNNLLSNDKWDFDNPKPTSYREPGYAWFLSFFINDKNMSKDDIKVPGKNQNLMLDLRKGQVLLLALSAIAALAVVYKITGSFWLGYLSMILFGFNMELIQNINSMMAEQTCIPLIIVMGAMFYYGFRDHKVLLLGIGGFLLGLLVLVKAIYMYMIVFLLVLGFIAFKGEGKKKIAIALSVMFACYIIPVGGWMIRNKVQVGKFHITNRAANVMALRVEYNKMNFTEWCGSFLYWTPDPAAQRLMQSIYGERCVNSMDGKLLKLNRGYKEGYYLVGKENGTTNPDTDATNQKTFAMEFVKHPIKHITTTLPIWWRGCMHGLGVSIASPITFIVHSPVFFSLLYSLSMAVAFIKAVIKKRWEIVGLVLPGVYLVFMNSFFTHGLTRYTLPALATEIICLMLILSQFKKRA